VAGKEKTEGGECLAGRGESRRLKREKKKRLNRNSVNAVTDRGLLGKKKREFPRNVEKTKAQNLSLARLPGQKGKRKMLQEVETGPPMKRGKEGEMVRKENRREV